jgi:hypothetical protein
VVGGQVVSFLTAHEHNPIPSPALLERHGLAFRRAVDSFAGAVWFSCNRTERRVTCYYFCVWDEGFGPAFAWSRIVLTMV